jgi:dipeptidyl aminopeptidase/acylaminoacyl peptidase
MRATEGACIKAGVYIKVRKNRHGEKQMRLLFRSIISISALLLTLTASAAAPDIADIMAAPYPGELASNQNGDRIAWVETDRGVRNVWTAKAPHYQATKLTAYRNDDGQEIGGDGLHGGSGLLVHPNGKQIIYVRGAGKSYDGVVPNPDSSATPAEQLIYSVSTEGGEPIRLASGSAPALLDGGNTLLFSADGKIQSLSLLKLDKITKPETAFTSRGTLGAFVPSPDGKEIAFVSHRAQYSLIGIFNRADRTLRWMAPNIKNDLNPVWSFDGTQIAFIRLAGSTDDEVYNITGAQAFSIVVADVKSGIGKTIFTSNDRAGGFAQSYTSRPLRWTASKQLVFYSEQEGWMRLYRIAANGGSPVGISPENCEVENSSQTNNGKTIFFTSNCANQNSRNIFRIADNEDISTAVTEGNVIDTDVLATNDNGPLFYRHADARQPTAVTMIVGENSQRVSSALPGNFPLASLVEPKTVTFKAKDGQIIHGQLFESAACSGKKCPALIYVHGGPIRQMLPGWHYFGYYQHNYAFNQWMALRGYVVLSVNYRAGIGYGQNFRRANNNSGPRGASEYQDVLAGHAYLSSLSNVESKRIGIWGGSYGGLLTAMALARNSDKFAAGVDLHGVHNWRIRAEREGGAGWGLKGEADYALAYKSSPIADVVRWKSPVLFIHGDHDSSVSITETVDIAERLRRQGTEFEVLMLPDEEHDFLRWATWERVMRASADFLDRKLKP